MALINDILQTHYYDIHLEFLYLIEWELLAGSHII
jgi:hypothetical protein